MGIYMRFDNGNPIKGDSTQQGFEGKDGWMNLTSFEWGLDRAFAKDQVGRASNREAAQAHVHRSHCHQGCRRQLGRAP